MVLPVEGKLENSLVAELGMLKDGKALMNSSFPFWLSFRRGTFVNVRGTTKSLRALTVVVGEDCNEFK